MSELEVSSEEVKLGLSLRDPVLWGQGYLRNRDGSPRVYWPHQVEDLRSEERNIIHLDGRGAGKSISLTTDALHFAFTTRGGQGLVAAPHQGHLDTLIEEMEFQIDSSPELTRSIVVTKYGNPKIYRKPYFRLEFTNGAILYFRPAGAYGDAFILNAALMLDFVWSLSSSGRWSHTFLTLSLRHRCNGFSERYTESMAFFRAFDPSITNSRFTPGVTPRLAMFSRNAVGSHVLWIVANLDNNSITKKHTLCPIAKY